MKFLHQYPFVRITAALIVGIIAFGYLQIPSWAILLGMGVALLAIIVSANQVKNITQHANRWTFGSCSLVFFVFLGYYFTQQKTELLQFDHYNEEAVYLVDIYQYPIEKERSLLCRVNIEAFVDSNSKQVQCNSKAILYLQKDSLSALLRSGDRLLIRARLNKPDSAQNPFGFDNRKYLSRQGFAATAYVSSGNWHKTQPDSSFSLLRMAENAQRKMLSIFKKYGIVGDEYAVLAALSLGSKDALHPELRQHYGSSGGMHILAVSGLHVGIIYMVLNFLFSFMNRKLRIPKVIIVIALLWAYAFITGLPPSVIRATAMFSMVAIGQAFERQSYIYNTIAVSAFFILLYNPNFIFDLGFQLSYCAVISIIYFQPKIAKWWLPKNKLLKWAWDLTAVSAAAQIGTFAFSLFYFQQFPNYFIITNFVAIPLGTLILYLAVALFIVSPIPFVASGIAFVLNILLKLLNGSIYAIQNLPYSVSFRGIDEWQLFLLFAMVFAASHYFEKKKFLSLALSICCALAFAGIDLAVHNQSTKLNKMLLYADHKHLHIDFVEGKNLHTISTDSAALLQVAKNFWFKIKLMAHIILSLPI
jgi:competence protein ComEC